jgi:toxin ParE1/3/4
MAQIIWTERAISDLNAIGEYISLDSEYNAKKIIQQLIKKADSILLYPERGRPIPENIPGNYRQVLYKSYRVIYRIEKSDIIICCVYHQKKLLFKIIE